MSGGKQVRAVVAVAPVVECGWRVMKAGTAGTAARCGMRGKADWGNILIASWPAPQSVQVDGGEEEAGAGRGQDQAQGGQEQAQGGQNQAQGGQGAGEKSQQGRSRRRRTRMAGRRPLLVSKPGRREPWQPAGTAAPPRRPRCAPYCVELNCHNANTIDWPYRLILVAVTAQDWRAAAVLLGLPDQQQRGGRVGGGAAAGGGAAPEQTSRGATADTRWEKTGGLKLCQLIQTSS